MHTFILKKVQPERKAADTFPTRYRLNTWHAIKQHFPESVWDLTLYAMNSEPAYFGNSLLAWRAALAVHRFLPKRFGTTLFIFAQKR